MNETPDQVAKRHERQRRLHGPPKDAWRCVEDLEVELAVAQEREKVWRAGFRSAVERLTSATNALRAGGQLALSIRHEDTHEDFVAAAELYKETQPPPFAGDPDGPLVGGLEPDKPAADSVTGGASWVVLDTDATTCLVVEVVPERTHLRVRRFGRNKIDGNWHEYGEELSEDFIPLDVLRQLMADYDKEGGK